MPMIDVYAVRGTFSDPHKVAQDVATAVKTVEQVPDLPLFRENTAGFVHELEPGHISDVNGSDQHVRVQVLTNAGALNRDQQKAVVKQITDIVAEAAGDPTLAQRTWVLLTEAVEGGWGIAGEALANEEIVAKAREQIAAAQQG